MKKRIFAAILAAAMLLCLLPTVSFAAGESGIQFGTGGLKANDEIILGKYTENGTIYDVPWIVLSKDTDKAFLLSKYLLGDSRFRTESTGYGPYKDSDLNSRMNDLYNGTNTLFTTQEQGAIASVDIGHLYPLSDNEAEALTWESEILKAKYITNQSGSAADWWLRSTSSGAGNEGVGVVKSGGYVLYQGYIGIVNARGVRPAFNLDLSSVLFTSAAVGGKSSGSEGAGALNSNLTPSGATAWKLTLRNNAAGSGRENFDVTTTGVYTTTLGGNVSISYSGAKVGTNEYLSAMLVDVNNNVLYYGRLKSLETSGASGTQDIAIPAGLTAGTYTLKVFNEQYNGDNQTDYASAFENVSLTVAREIEFRTTVTHIQWHYLDEAELRSKAQMVPTTPIDGTALTAKTVRAA